MLFAAIQKLAGATKTLVDWSLSNTGFVKFSPVGRNDIFFKVFIKLLHYRHS